MPRPTVACYRSKKLSRVRVTAARRLTYGGHAVLVSSMKYIFGVSLREREVRRGAYEH